MKMVSALNLLCCVLCSSLVNASETSIAVDTGEDWRRYIQLRHELSVAKAEDAIERVASLQAALEELRVAYREHVSGMMSSIGGSFPNRDPIINATMAALLLVRQRRSPEEVLAEGFKNDAAIEAIWALDEIIGRDRSFQEKWLNSFERMPSNIIFESFTPQVLSRAENLLPVYVSILLATDGSYREGAVSKMLALMQAIPEIVSRNVEVVTQVKDEIRDGACAWLTQEELQQLRQTYIQAQAPEIASWFHCKSYDSNDDEELAIENSQ
jgi:hypothetical protein